MKLLDALVEQRIAFATQQIKQEQDIEDECCCCESNISVLKTVLFARELLKKAGFAEPDSEQMDALAFLSDELDALAGRSVSYPLYASVLALDMAFESVRCDAQVLPKEYCQRIARRLNARLQRASF